MARQVTIQVQGAGKPLSPGDDFLRFSLTQRLSGHHTFSLAVPFDRIEDPQTAFFSQTPENLLGQPLSVSIMPDTAFHFNTKQILQFKGVVTGLSAGQESDYTASINVQGYSPCRLLADGIQKRTFVKQTLADIFRQVLAPYPANLLPTRIEPAHTAPLAYVVQYQESNFTFLSRLAAEYGEWFYYDGEKLHLGSPATGQEIELVADGIYTSFQFSLALQPARVTLYDYNYQQHQHFTSDTSAQQVPTISQHRYSKLALEQSEKLFAQPSHTTAETFIPSAAALTEEAKFLKASRAANLVMVQGHSDNPALQLGRIIRVNGEGLGSRYTAAENFGTYRLTELTHHVDARGNYRNSFTAIPHLLDVPPIYSTYAPPQGQSELAEVIDDKDPEKLGRLRVRYYWPVQNKKHAETNWIRLLTPYSGDGKGHLMKPEVGSQVLVGYQGGLAEQPFVLGNMFHANNKQSAKYSPDGNLMKGLQTAGGNKFVMMDTKGDQKIHISNSNNKGTAITVGFNGDGSIHIQTSGPVTVNGSTITLEAGDKGEINMHAKNITIDAEEEIKVTSASKSIALKAEKDITADATAKMTLSAKEQSVSTTGKMEISSGSTVDISGTSVKING
ncbi:type VI secretion system Vgr family protein [Hymenobacter norwichensis]|uniref:type VI secretion system Vgr family protein n=1 Tax=Hymenobacter norwichensis TaxID=223903 RepID=UPI0003B2E25A|nr:contractile injection system protein, VgrG/Pvc8 family [Hymenobacter norwichensis]